MYAPSYFRETDLTELDRLVACNPFATLITLRDGTPVATHLPVLYARAGGQVVFRGHWARPNPQWHDASQALLIVHGPHAYVSPTWYPDKEAAARVPTWNYAAAHITGALEIIDDLQALAGIVSALSDQHETLNGSDWRFEPERADHRVQLKGIVGFRLEASRIELKFKLNQNHPVANRHAVADALAKKPDDASRAVADLMRRRRSPPMLPEDTQPTDPATEP